MALQTMYPGKVGSPVTTLSTTITSTATTISVQAGTALPDAPNLATIGSGENAEVIRYGTKVGGTLSNVTRGFQGTAQSHAAGTTVARFLTEYDLSSLQANVTENNNEKIDKSGSTPTLDITSTDDATSPTSAPLKSAGGLAVAKTLFSKVSKIFNTTVEYLSEIRIFASNSRAPRVRRAVLEVNKTSLGTKLIIPFESQSSLNVRHYVTVKGQEGSFNNSGNRPFMVQFGVRSLDTLSTPIVVSSGGNFDSIAVNGMNVEITFTNSYSSSVLIDFEIMTDNDLGQPIPANITMN